MKDFRKGWGEDQFLLETVQTDKAVQQQIFNEMINLLENAGKCHGNFHLLAFHLFGNSMGEW